MGIVYLITLIVLSAMFFVLKKSEKSLNAIAWVSITTLLALCYNVFICYVLSLFKIECNLVVLSGINLIFVILIGYKIKKDGEVQKYEVKVNEILFSVGLFLIVIIVTFAEFKMPLNIKYETTDPAIHYAAALGFYEKSTLLNYVEPGQIFNFETFKPASYVNTGLLFKAFSGFMPEIDFYKLFILFDIFTLYLGGMLFFSLIARKIKKGSTYLIGAIFAIIYTLGYPLNSLVFGFEYLSFGINTIIAILILAPFLKSREFNFLYIVGMITLLNFALFLSYYLFIPVVFVSLGVYMLIYMLKNRRKPNILSIFTKKNVLSVLSIFVFPTILGLTLLVFPTMLRGEQSVIAVSVNEGYIYKDLYGYLLLFIPFVLYYILNCIKEKNFTIECLMIVFTVICAIIFFALGMMGIVSAYFFYKLPYLFWGLILYATFVSLCKFEDIKEVKNFAYLFVITYVCILMYAMLFVDQRINEKNSYFISNNKVSAVVGIYAYNESKVLSNYAIFYEEEIEILRYYNNLKTNDTVAIYGDKEQQLWIYAMLKITNYSTYPGFDTKQVLSIDDWLSQNKHYMLYFKNSNKFETINDSNEYSIVYQNEFGGILERK